MATDICCDQVVVVVAHLLAELRSVDAISDRLRLCPLFGTQASGPTDARIQFRVPD